MVNEFNRPSRALLEDDQLRTRLEISSRNIQVMQQEHHHLMQQLESLRRRTVDLAAISPRRNVASPSEEPMAEEQGPLSDDVDADDICNAAKTTDETITSSTLVNVQSACDDDTVSSNVPEDSSSPSAANDGGAANPLSEDYMHQKLAEISKMKKQFQRIQQLMANTSLIEDHLSRTSAEATATNAIPSGTETVHNMEPSCDPLVANNNNDLDGGQPVLTTILAMFNEFTTGMREEVSELRTERERLRALKEEIINRRRRS